MAQRLFSIVVLLAAAQTCLASRLAANPSPVDGRTGIAVDITLAWTPGDKVGNYVAGQKTDGHHVFFHTNISWVNGATTNYPLGTVYGHYRADVNHWSYSDPVFGGGSPLATDKTYCWRVIEVNSAEPNGTWTGPVWSIKTIGPKAAGAIPDNGETGIPLNAALSWVPGTQIAYSPNGGHDIYLGTSQSAVTDANISNPLGVYIGRQDASQFSVSELALQKMYYWRVDEANDSTGIVKGDVWAFTTTGTSAASPSPADGAVIGEIYDSSVDVTLSWKRGAYAADTDGHDVFFGTYQYAVQSATPSNPLDVYIGRQTTTAFQLNDIQLDTTFYWRIDEVNLVHPSSPWKGTVWSFRTDSGKAKNPSPSDNAQDVTVEPTLFWTAGYGATSHDVYFGTASSPPFIRNQSSVSYTPSRLNRDTTYYWRIDEKTPAGTKQGDVWSFKTAAGPVVTVDQSITYQTIDGFGAHGAMNVWWSGGPFYNDAFLNLIVNDLGLTINRNEYYPKPNEPGQWPKQIGWLQALKAKADASGEPIKFIAAYWTPPYYMKDPPVCCTYEGDPETYIRPDCYDDLGTYSVQTIQDYKDIGIDLYGLSLQNECNFAEPYNSCVYMHNSTTNQYRDMLKVTGPIIHSSWPNVKLYGAEHMLWVQEWDATNYEFDIINDPCANAEMGIWAVHGYGNDGQTPDPGSAEAAVWTFAKNRFEPTGKHFWMTETSGYNETWAQSRQLAQSIYAALRYGHISGWVWWQLSEDDGLGNPPGEYVLLNNGVPGKRYYVSKQYYRYIRPEAVMVKSISDDPNVYIVAFKHNTQKTATVVLINTSASAKPVHLNIDGDILPETFNIYRTSASENCINAGTVLLNGTLSLPASSIATLYGTDMCSRCDFNADTRVDFKDYSVLAGQWRSAPGNPSADIIPAPTGDGIVNMSDLAAFVQCWLE
jgi:O-glycosyl hydrolase